MSGPVIQSHAPAHLSASGLVHTGPCRLSGIFVASTSSGTIKIYDGTNNTGTVVVNTFTPPAAGWYWMQFNFNVGMYVELANTIDITVSWEP